VNALLRNLTLALAALLVLLGAAGAPATSLATPQGADPGLTLTGSKDVVRSGSALRLTAHLAAPAAMLQVSREYAGETTYTHLRTVVTDAAGSASWSTSPAGIATYKVEFAGDSVWAAASAELVVHVSPKLTFSATGGDRVFTGDPVKTAVQVAPVHAGDTVDVQLWNDASRTWGTVQTLTLGADGRAHGVWRPEKTGTVELRAHVAAAVEHLSGGSATVSLKVFDPSNPYGVPSGPPHLILVDLSQYKLYYYEHGRVIRVFDCVLGRPSLPTPQGHFHIYAKDPHMYGPYGPRRMRYLGAYAVHGTDEPWLLDRYPRNYSHGCTRLSNAHILWLYDRVPVGTPVWNVP